MGFRAQKICLRTFPQLSAVPVSLNLRPTKSSSGQPGMLQSLVLGQAAPAFCGVQQPVFPNLWLASAHCVVAIPKCSASIWVVAAQHQLLVSWVRSAFGTEPTISGLQHPLSSMREPMPSPHSGSLDVIGHHLGGCRVLNE